MNIKLCGLAVAAAAVAGTASADVTIIAEEVGNDVVITSEGTYDVSGLDPDPENPFDIGAGVAPLFAVVNFGPLGLNSYDYFFGFTSSPSNFGSGFPGGLTSSSGDLFSLQNDGSVGVPVGVTSGTANATMTYANQTFETLGMDPGTYVWTWDNAAPIPSAFDTRDVSSTIETVTFTIGPMAAVPLPAGLPLLLAGLGGLAWLRRRSA